MNEPSSSAGMPTTVDDTADYLIYSGHHGKWWKPLAMGYTGLLSEAGRYTEAEAIAYIVRSAGCGDPESVARMVRDTPNFL